MTTPTREIRFDRTTKDFALFLDGECVGYAASYIDGETRLDEIIYERLIHEARLQPIQEEESCPGLQFPCGKPATRQVNTWTGSDCETRRSVALAYCPECYAEMQKVEEASQASSECLNSGMTFPEACLVAAYEDDGSYPIECALCGAWHIARPNEMLRAA